MDVFDERAYRPLIQKWIEGSEIKGVRSRLARAARCTPSWITRVLNGNVHLTPDQALGVAREIGLGAQELEYFLLLVDLERASSPELRSRIEEKLKGLRQNSVTLQASIKNEASVSEEHALVYYSSWVYSAVHVASMLGPLSIEEISVKVGLSRPTTEKTLASLRKMGLVVFTASRYKATSMSVHLPAQNTLANVAHASLARTRHSIPGRSEENIAFTTQQPIAYREEIFSRFRKLHQICAQRPQAN